ncbi:MAG: hypothetical protein U0L60_04665, partial [Ruminococcus sp.]|nr:hypothetical protein [Ruminococcus sp.]
YFNSAIVLSLFCRQRDAAPSPPIEAFGLEENTCNGVSIPCVNIAITLGKEIGASGQETVYFRDRYG